MRLIDADAFKELWKGCKIKGSLDALIDTRPTVDAIPIERLEQEIDRYIDLGLNSVAKELRTIVDEWRKENE